MQRSSHRLLKPQWAELQFGETHAQAYRFFFLLFSPYKVRN